MPFGIILFFCNTITIVEFDKMRIQTIVIYFYKKVFALVSLATIEVRVFVRRFRSAHFFIYGGFMKRLVCFLMLSLFLFGLVACGKSGTNNGNTSPTKEGLVGNYDLYYYYDQNNGYEVTVRGKMKNTDKTNYSALRIIFTIYGKSNNKIGTATTVLKNFKYGDEKSFVAEATSWIKTEPFSCKLTGVELA